MELTIVTLWVSVLLRVVFASNGPADGPRICVTNSGSGLKIPIHVYLNETVRDVKQLLYKMDNYLVPPDKQELRFRNLTLDDNQTLEHYNIGRHSDLELIYHISEASQYKENVSHPTERPSSDDLRGPKPATVAIQLIGSSTFTIDVDLTDSVGVVKQKIHKQEEYAIKDQRLYFELFSIDPLEDSKTLEHVGVGNGTALLLRVPPGQWCYNGKWSHL